MDYLKYHKLESVFEALAKDDMSLKQALDIARKHNPEAGKALANHIYKDSLVPRVGNRYAYNDFLKRHANSGTHVSIDGNSFGSINKQHGFETGDKAIKQIFNSIADVSRKYGGKAFKIGGDEAKLHFSTPERAHGFAKELQQRLASDPKVAGHQLSASIGIGHNPEHAEQALIQAKDQLGPLVDGKRKKLHAPGMEPTVYHSLVHEAPPPNWKPEKEHINTLPHEAAPTTGLSMKNPLK